MPSTLTIISAIILGATAASAAEVVVSTRQAAHDALANAQPGDVISIAPGIYEGGLSVRSLKGTPESPITVQAQKLEDRPIFDQGQTGLHLSECEHVILQHLIIKRAAGNGINIDDGGTATSPSHHIVLQDIDVLQTGPTGNRDGIKLSGVDGFLVRRCRISGWGGSGIDMVGCHNGVIEDCHFSGMEGFSQSNAIQMKGGSSDLLVHKNVFHNVGQRAINIGGHTGLPYFRPEVKDYEATRIEVAGNEFRGSLAPIAWATAQGGWVHHNTFLYPEKWVLRILQENNAEQFQPSRDGRFENNVSVYDPRVSVAVNIGGGTAPETFHFNNNYWLTPLDRAPRLPTPDANGEYATAEGDIDFDTILAEQASRGRGAASYQEGLVFASDFESGTWFREWGLTKKPDLTETVSHDPERLFEPVSGKALRIQVRRGGHYGASLQYDFHKRTGAEPEEIYFRYYLRFANDWKPERGGKLPGIAGTYGRAGWGGRPVDGTDGWSARGLFSGRQEGKTPIGYYCYHADMKGKYGAHWEWDKEQRGLLENNRWYCIEQFVKMNTPKENDGILRGWVDGELAFEKTDLRLRDVDTLKIETVWLNVYYGGSWTAQQDYHLYIDNVVISRNPIGPRAASE